MDPIQLLRLDPAVSPRVKASLKPCAGDTYPVDTSSGNLTGGPRPDVVVNVLTCGGTAGIGTYVYRDNHQKYQNVFTVEAPAVYGTIDRGELVVTQLAYASGDPMVYPSDEDIVTYEWAGTRFTERYRVRNSYSRAVGNGGEGEPEPSAPSQN